VSSIFPEGSKARKAASGGLTVALVLYFAELRTEVSQVARDVSELRAQTAYLRARLDNGATMHASTVPP
jgi:hypothetical protein